LVPGAHEPSISGSRSCPRAYKSVSVCRCKNCKSLELSETRNIYRDLKYRNFKGIGPFGSLSWEMTFQKKEPRIQLSH
jgi:hypothetical protein